MGETKKKPAIYLKIGCETENAHISSCVWVWVCLTWELRIETKPILFLFLQKKILQNENVYAEMKVKNE